MTSFLLATHALVFLAHKGERVSSQALADNICANAAEVRRVMCLLKDAELVEVKDGRNGGYALKKAASDINLAEVALATQSHFLGGSWFSGDSELDCIISSGMGPWAKKEQELLEAEVLKTLASQSITSIESELTTQKE